MPASEARRGVARHGIARRGIARLGLWPLALLCALLAGCETMPQALNQLPGMSSLAQKPASPLEALPAPEARAWPDPQQDVINQRARGFGLVHAPEAQRYLNGLLARIKAAALVPDWPGEVYLLAQSSLSAYATAAGNIYVSLPWLQSVQSEDELVALLAHEFGHIYLHYHSLEGAIAGADTAAGFASLGLGIAYKTAQATGWNQVDTLQASYALGKTLTTALYGQTQEGAADRFALHVTHRLGYSYEHGAKAFLERQAGWEQQNETLELQKQEALKQALQASTIERARRTAPQSNNAVSTALNDASANLQAGINGGLNQASFDLSRWIGKLTSAHPETVKRQDSLAEIAERYPEVAEDRAPTQAPLQAALAQKRTQLILKNYQAAYKAMEAPQSPGAVALARQAASGPTATHAVPLFALYSAASAQPGAVRGLPRDLGSLFEANFNSETDRAWALYTERSTRLKESGQRDASKKLLERGLQHFAVAEETMPYAVRFYGEVDGWERAKQQAQQCRQRFPRVAGRCDSAARSPQEVAEIDRRTEKKASEITDRWLKKK
ncbi:M48 family metalloprotease [Comamonas antarctica]|uniref:M48 family metalloprotease n=1 Tax=Comamonas antarctica TaxID=2743470 RepID=UPI0028E7BD00|nr:M48 family metalloprotease [Comamonas antarctica]